MLQNVKAAGVDGLTEEIHGYGLLVQWLCRLSKSAWRLHPCLMIGGMSLFYIFHIQKERYQEWMPTDRMINSERVSGKVFSRIMIERIVAMNKINEIQYSFIWAGNRQLLRYAWKWENIYHAFVILLYVERGSIMGTCLNYGMFELKLLNVARTRYDGSRVWSECFANVKIHQGIRQMCNIPWLFMHS